MINAILYNQLNK